MTVRDELWEVALDQHGYVTTGDARRLGVAPVELRKLAQRGKLVRAAQGVYRFPGYPVSPRGQLMEAVLWARDPLAALSHETVLDAYELSDVNPGVIHVTVPRREKPPRRRSVPPEYIIHREDLRPDQLYYWEQIPCVTVETAIGQVIAERGRPDLAEQAIGQALDRGLVSAGAADGLRRELEGVFS